MEERCLLSHQRGGPAKFGIIHLAYVDGGPVRGYQLYRSGGWVPEARQDMGARRLPGARSADQGERLPGWNGRVDAVQHGTAAVVESHPLQPDAQGAGPGEESGARAAAERGLDP